MAILNSEEILEEYKHVVAIQCVTGNWIDGMLHNVDKIFDEHDNEQYEKYLKDRKQWEMDCFIIGEGELRITGGRNTRYHLRNPYNISVPRSQSEVSWSGGGDYWGFTLRPIFGERWDCEWDKETEAGWEGRFLNCKVTKKKE